MKDNTVPKSPDNNSLRTMATSPANEGCKGFSVDHKRNENSNRIPIAACLSRSASEVACREGLEEGPGRNLCPHFCRASLWLLYQSP
jgi:hypothetical protein